MLIGNIYKLTSPSGRCYIGQTIHLDRRIKSYRRLNCKEQHKLYNAIIKYGFDNMKLDVLFQYNSTDRSKLNILLDAMEKFCIKKYDSVYSGYNIRFGGTGGKCTEETLEKMRFAQSNRSEETRRKMSDRLKGKRLPEIAYERSRASNTGRKMSQELKDKIRKWSVGHTVTEEHRETLRIMMTNRIISDETRLKMSISSTGRKHTDETKKKISECSKNLSDNTRKKLSNSRIANAGRNTASRKIINNGSWFSESGLSKVRNAALIGMGVVRLDLNWNYIDEFISINEAKRNCNISQDTIRKSIQGKYIRDNRFIWIKKDDYYKTNKNIENNESLS